MMQLLPEEEMMFCQELQLFREWYFSREGDADDRRKNFISQ